MPNVVVIATARAKPGKEQELERALREVAPPTRAQPGCAQFSLYRSQEDPAIIVGVERWASKADHDRHLHGPHFQKLGTEMGSIIAGAPDIVWYEIADETADIRHSMQIAAKPEEIYPLVATAKGFGQWWATDISEPPGVAELGFFNRASIYRLRPTSQQPPSSVEWVCESGDEWSDTRISFHMEPVKAGTLLHFEHAGWRAHSEYFRSCNTTWGELMFRLKAAAEGKTPGPLFTREGWVA